MYIRDRLTSLLEPITDITKLQTVQKATEQLGTAQKVLLIAIPIILLILAPLAYYLGLGAIATACFAAGAAGLCQWMRSNLSGKYKKMADNVEKGTRVLGLAADIAEDPLTRHKVQLDANTTADDLMQQSIDARKKGDIEEAALLAQRAKDARNKADAMTQETDPKKLAFDSLMIKAMNTPITFDLAKLSKYRNYT